MTCISCEKRREFIKKQIKSAKESWKRLINRDSGQTNRGDNITESSDSDSKSTTHRNRGSKQSVNESGAESD